MGSEQFSMAVRGSSAEPVSTNATGTMETDNYEHGGAFSFDGGGYPYTVNPDAVIQELWVTRTADIVARITTTGGDTFDLELAGATIVADKWEIDKVEFRDPKGVGAAIAGGWAGE
jgi:hypothetical protein